MITDSVKMDVAASLRFPKFRSRADEMRRLQVPNKTGRLDEPASES
jgi:hypothetical protein